MHHEHAFCLFFRVLCAGSTDGSARSSIRDTAALLTPLAAWPESFASRVLTAWSFRVLSTYHGSFWSRESLCLCRVFRSVADLIWGRGLRARRRKAKCVFCVDHGQRGRSTPFARPSKGGGIEGSGAPGNARHSRLSSPDCGVRRVRACSALHFILVEARARRQAHTSAPSGEARPERSTPVPEISQAHITDGRRAVLPPPRCHGTRMLDACTAYACRARRRPSRRSEEPGGLGEGSARAREGARSPERG